MRRILRPAGRCQMADPFKQHCVRLEHGAHAACGPSIDGTDRAAERGRVGMISGETNWDSRP